MAGALKSVNAIDPELFGGYGTDYSEKYREAQEAESRLMEMLKNRRGGSSGGFRLDPAMLALAGEFLDPGRTGSFGEALGRGAKSYAAAQAAEEKSAQDEALVQMQLAQMQLDRARRGQAMKEFKTLTEDVTPMGGVGPVAGDKSGPAVMVQGRVVTPAIVARAKLVDKDFGDALETQYKLQLETMGSQPSGTFNKITGEFRPFPGAEQRKEFVPELGGDIAMSPEDAQSIREARNRNDAKTVYSIIDKYQKGVGPRPSVSTTEEVSIEETKPKDITVSGREASAAAQKEKATTMSKEAAERTSKFLASADEAQLARAAAAQNLEILRRNPKIVGYLNKPGVGNALWQIVQDSLSTHSASGRAGLDVDIKRTDLESALMKVDPNFKLEDFTDLGILAGNLARMELGLRRATYAGSGMGAVSNLEGQPIKDTLGSRYDTPAALSQKMMMAGRAFDFDMDVATAYRKYTEKPGNEYKTLEDFKRDSKDGTYNRLLTGFESWLSNNLSIPFRKKDSGVTTPSKTSIMDEVERRRKAGKLK